MCVREGSKNWRESVILENGAGLGEVLQSSPTAARRQEGSGQSRWLNKSRMQSSRVAQGHKYMLFPGYFASRSSNSAT